MPTYEEALQDPSFKDNVVIRINDGLYFAKRAPVLGLDVPAGQCVIKAKGGLTVNPQVIDLLEAKTSFASNSFILIDLDQVITRLFTDNLNAFMGQKVEIWLGRSGIAMDFADYLKLPDSFVSAWSFKAEEFSFTSSEITKQFNKPIYNTAAKVADNTNAGAVELVAAGDISGFPDTGRLFLGKEFIAYTAKDNDALTFTLATATLNDMTQGDDIFLTYQVTGNPLDIFLQVLQSTGGGTYDTLPEGLGLQDDQIDIAGIEVIRDEVFAGEIFTFEMFDLENGILPWFEKEIFKTCSLRVISSVDSKLSLTVLDQSIFGSAVELDEATIDPKSVLYAADNNDVHNIVQFNYGYDYTTKTYTKSHQESDQESIDNYGELEPYVIESQGVPAGPAGAAIALDRTTRWLNRISTASPTVQLDSFFVHSLVLVGQRVLLSYDLPSVDGTRHFSKDLEILSKGLDIEKGLTKLKLGFTNYSGLREGYISPADQLIAVFSQRVAQVSAGRGGQYKVGWVMRLRTVDGITTDAPRTIALIDGDVIHFDDDFDTVLDSDYSIQFADYDEVVQDQRRYAFLSADTANFFDGTRPYQITF